ncbi:MAG: type II secretion system protein GspC [Bradymonadales bacterium]|jgi:general secretion pathway protein C
MNSRIRIAVALVAFVLLVGASYFIAKGVSAFISQKLVALTPYEVSALPATAPTDFDAYEDKTLLLYNRNLFNQKGGMEDEPPQEPEPVVEHEEAPVEALGGDRPILTSLKIKLLGTQVASDARYSLAMIGLLDEPIAQPLVLGVGGEVLNEAVVVGIVRNKVYFRRHSHGNRIEYIDIDTTAEDVAAAAASAPPPTPAKVAKPEGEPAKAIVDASVIKRVGPDTYAIPRATAEEVRRNPKVLQDPKFGAIPKLQPVYKKGAISGYRLLDVAPDSIYSQLGIRSGDTLLDINGQQLDNPQKAMSFFDQLQPGQDVGIKINRNGQERTLTYKLN